MKVLYKGHKIETRRDGEGVHYVVNDIFSCDMMSEALELIEILIKEAKNEG
ncbi:MAG: hypothetical protein ACRCX2_28280 [Paraclostridium sp.]